jgi:hypothetical protein
MQPSASVPSNHVAGPLRVAVVFAAFPAKDLVPYKYFVLLLNHLQKSCEFELVDLDEDDAFVHVLSMSGVANADQARAGLADFGTSLHSQIAAAIVHHDLAAEQPDQIVVVTGVTLSDYHYLIRRGSTTLLALGSGRSSWLRHH